MHFENIDSISPPEVATLERICAAGGRTLTALARTPVYWVSPNLMDQLYDPWRYSLLSEDCVRRAMEEQEKNKDGRAVIEDTEDDNAERFIAELERFWKDLEECSKSMVRVHTPALGVYIRKITKEAVKAVGSARRGQGKLRQAPKEDEVAIFVCPERCRERIDAVEVTSLSHVQAVECSVAQVVFHELRHAWFNTDYAIYSTPWGRLIEESLCDWVSVTHFESMQEASLINQLLEQDRGFEYRCYSFWRNYSKENKIPKSWKTQELRDLEVLLVWRRGRSFRSISISDDLFGKDFDEFVHKHLAKLGEKAILRAFWMATARTILESYYNGLT